MAKAATGNVLYVCQKIAERDGINVERLTAYHRMKGIKVVTKKATDNGDGTYTCHGCDKHWPRKALYWQVCDRDGGLFYQEVCRECEGLVLKCTDRANLWRLDKMDERVAIGIGSKSEKYRTSTSGRPAYGDRFITVEESRRRAAAKAKRGQKK